MQSQRVNQRIAILGGGPSALFLYKHLIETQRTDVEIDIIERKNQLGAGMPYSTAGASSEHVTNVSGNEIPALVTSLTEWIQQLPTTELQHFQLNPNRLSDYKVVPRLLFGQYLAAQFELLKQQAEHKGIRTRIHLNTEATDMLYLPESQQVQIQVNAKNWLVFDAAIICTGHNWPSKHEGKVPFYFDSPYPPTKLALTLNHPVAIRGASLTAIDAIRTLARHNGHFETDSSGRLIFKLAASSPDFRLILHSREGLLPAIRFHLEEPMVFKEDLLSPELIAANRCQNEGFLSLDFVFEQAFKVPLRQQDPAFYELIEAMTLEEFVEAMMGMREQLDPFEFFSVEYRQAEQSIRQHQSIYWKERLAVLSFAMNYPAKYFSAEDMERLKKVLMPLIALVIASIPQRSAQELLALHQAGVLSLQAVGEDSEVVANPKGGATYHFLDGDNQPRQVAYPMFVDCIGQPHLAYEDFPFKGLLRQRAVSPARLAYRSREAGQAAVEQGNPNVELQEDGTYYLTVPGLAITDDFQLIDSEGQPNARLFMMAVPYMGGYNPDYSGLDFCETASAHIVRRLLAVYH